MTLEQHRPKRPHEIFGITDEEISRWRISDEKLKEILANPNTTIHSIQSSSNMFGEFLFLTASRGLGQERVCMTFWGLGYHNYRERWITQEWFWQQTPTRFVKTENEIPSEEATQKLKAYFEDMLKNADQKPQSEAGALFEVLADLTDDDAALAEMQDMGLF